MAESYQKKLREILEYHCGFRGDEPALIEIKEELEKYFGCVPREKIARELFMELQQQKNTMFVEPHKIELDVGKIALKESIEIMQNYLITKYKFEL